MRLVFGRLNAVDSFKKAFADGLCTRKGLPEVGAPTLLMGAEIGVAYSFQAHQPILHSIVPGGFLGGEVTPNDVGLPINHDSLDWLAAIPGMIAVFRQFSNPTP
ncbi:MAG: hypothetical protein P8J37_00620 [Fuerstiella sp.]|nr:hypothetical protein [Fuerstiella sp.]